MEHSTDRPADLAGALVWHDELVDFGIDQAHTDAQAIQQQQADLIRLTLSLVTVQNSILNTQQALIRAVDQQSSVLTAILTAIQSAQPNIQPVVTPVTVQNSYFEQPAREKLSKRLLAAAEWIVTHDPGCKLSVRQIATGAGVSIGTAQAAIKLVRDENRQPATDIPAHIPQTSKQT